MEQETGASRSVPVTNRVSQCESPPFDQVALAATTSTRSAPICCPRGIRHDVGELRSIVRMGPWPLCGMRGKADNFSRPTLSNGSRAFSFPAATYLRAILGPKILKQPSFMLVGRVTCIGP
jgi:hypothetical protein